MVTGVGGVFAPSGTSFAADLLIDGTTQLKAQLLPGTSVIEGPSGLVVKSGQLVEVTSSTGTVAARAWGYLIPNNGAHYDRLIVPGPLNWLTIDQGTPFNVPAGKHLVITAAGTTNAPYSELRINGVVEHSVSGQQFDSSLSSPNVPVGLKAGPGDIVEITSPFSPGRAYGYLVNL